MNQATLEESELELRFLSWLERQVKQQGGKFQAVPVQRGKSGYLLQIGNATWEIEPQVELCDHFCVKEPARADFLFRQTSGSEDLSLPIAVFLDGWEFHKDRIHQDVRQRLAIKNSGQLLVWSMTWDDVQDDDGKVISDLWNPFKAMDVTEALWQRENRFGTS